MPKTTQELAASKAGSTAESNGFGAAEKPYLPGGVYELRDPDDGNRLVDTQILKSHPLFGDSQAAAFIRVGYKYVRDADPSELHTLEIQQGQVGNTSSNEEIKGIMARLSAVEDENKALRAEKQARDAEDRSGSHLGEVQAQSQADAKAEATARVQARTEGAADETARTEELKADTPAATGADAQAEQPAGDPLADEADESAPKKGGLADANTNTNTKKAGK
jgi:hypothetical protein